MDKKVVLVDVRVGKVVRDFVKMEKKISCVEDLGEGIVGVGGEEGVVGVVDGRIEGQFVWKS